MTQEETAIFFLTIFAAFAKPAGYFLWEITIRERIIDIIEKIADAEDDAMLSRKETFLDKAPEAATVKELIQASWIARSGKVESLREVKTRFKEEDLTFLGLLIVMLLNSAALSPIKFPGAYVAIVIFFCLMLIVVGAVEKVRVIYNRIDKGQDKLEILAKQIVNEDTYIFGGVGIERGTMRNIYRSRIPKTMLKDREKVKSYVIDTAVQYILHGE